MPGRTSGKEEALKFHQMVPYMKAGGKVTKLTGKGDSSMLMVTFMMGNGSMIRHMDLVDISILMEPHTKATGKTISSMEMGWRPGLMARDIKVSTGEA